jgi:hypothetical protein
MTTKIPVGIIPNNEFKSNNQNINGVFLDSNIGSQISTLIKSLLIPKLEISPYNILALEIKNFSSSSFKVLKKYLTIPDKAENLFLGFSSDTKELILAGKNPNEINILNAIHNNPNTKPVYLILHKDFNQFSGKMEMILEILKQLTQISNQDDILDKIEKANDISARDMNVIWKRVEDLKKYTNSLAEKIRQELEAEVTNRLNRKDLNPLESEFVLDLLDENLKIIFDKLHSKYEIKTENKNQIKTEVNSNFRNQQMENTSNFSSQSFGVQKSLSATKESLKLSETNNEINPLTKAIDNELQQVLAEIDKIKKSNNFNPINHHKNLQR